MVHGASAPTNHIVYPVYFVLGNGMIAATIVHRRRRLAVATTQAAPRGTTSWAG